MTLSLFTACDNKDTDDSSTNEGNTDNDNTDGDNTEGGDDNDDDENDEPVEKQYVRDGNKILFGTYPQSEVTDDAVKAALNAKAGALPTSENAQSWTSYGYYAAGKVSNYMWYVDIEEGGEKYRGVYFTAYRPNGTDKNSNADNSRQDENGYAIETVHWFKYESISWTILSENAESGTAIILCEMIIDAQEYDSGSNRNNNYANSTIRQWLNETFFNVTFSELQKQIIVTTTVDNSVSSTVSVSNNFACRDTEDKIFLLSKSEVMSEANGFPADQFTNDESRVKQSTDYARSQGASDVIDASGEAACSWWRRSPHYSNSENVSFVQPGGNVDYNTYIYYTNYGVVPALQITL